MSKEDKADRNLQILVEYGWSGISTKALAEKYGCSVRTVQLIAKQFKTAGYASLYNQPVVETDKYISGKLAGVTIYTREPARA